MNSLYAWVMCQKLPMKNFNWCKDLTYINQKFIKNYDEDSSEKGCILEVGVEYPKNYKMSTKIYHFYLKRLKLTCNFFDKTRYMVHIKLLQQALNHGQKLKKVHRVNEFEQSDWMKKYIMLNIELRKKNS